MQDEAEENLQRKTPIFIKLGNPDMSLTVLLTNLRLEDRTGTELYVRDIALGLLAKGHRPVVYSPRLGNLAREIRAETIPVVDDLNSLAVTPDIIHGHHSNETLTALLHFPNVPAIFFSHDWYFAEDFPPQFPRILRYVAVDQPCFDKLVCEYGVPEARVSLLPQFVEMDRFQARAPLPAKPSRAVILCNYTTENEHLEAARAACAKSGVSLDVFGRGVGQPCAEPEKLLRDYDIVFAKGRAALEALAVGNAVIVYWWRRLGPMVNNDDFDRLQQLNFGVRSMSRRLTPTEFGLHIEQALSAYNAEDARAVSDRVRASCGRDELIDQCVELYEEVLEEHQGSAPANPDEEAKAAAAHLRKMSVLFWKQRETMYSSTPFRLTERVMRFPVLGGLARAFARAAAGRRER